MELNEKEEEALVSILDYESSVKSDGKESSLECGWCWSDVRVSQHVLRSLFLKGYIDMVYKSNSYTGYRLISEKLKEVSVIASSINSDIGDDVEIHDSIFDQIIGYESTKKLLLAALRADKQIHVLLCGPPAIAKSMFLWAIERVVGEESMWMVGSATSKAGIVNAIAANEPKYLLVDELDKMVAVDTSSLLSLMEGGRLTRTKVGKYVDKIIPLKVIAATNRDDKIPPELMSRFAIRRLKPYTEEQFKSVVVSVLANQEGMNVKDAERVASALSGRTQNIRDAIRVARVAGELGVDDAISLLLHDA